MRLHSAKNGPGLHIYRQKLTFTSRKSCLIIQKTRRLPLDGVTDRERRHHSVFYPLSPCTKRLGIFRQSSSVQILLKFPRFAELLPVRINFLCIEITESAVKLVINGISKSRSSAQAASFKLQRLALQRCIRAEGAIEKPKKNNRN